jgi:hypothetical protein
MLPRNRPSRKFHAHPSEIEAVVPGNSGLATFGLGKGGIWTSLDSGNTWLSNNVPSASWTCATMSADGDEYVADMGIRLTKHICKMV